MYREVRLVMRWRGDINCIQDDFLREAALELTEKVNIEWREKLVRPNPNCIHYTQRGQSVEESSFSSLQVVSAFWNRRLCGPMEPGEAGVRDWETGNTGCMVPC